MDEVVECSDISAKKQTESENGEAQSRKSGKKRNSLDIHAIVEVNPDYPRSKGGYNSFLRQMGWEMMFWIAHCQDESLMKNRWITMVECADEVYVDVEVHSAM
ncbi:hypothetical protein N7516_001063 [Penicillium verrucosum]|uniref:uncharacterized protein n=1 Tax=Penicillium verrucosum TaxID=60171 RepID=UPI0025456D7A|nr:uncharacterized protein N7516_001063 [Penicillium verrucosum]KAJ5940895.1 hypothetical protein N7516_001063 [Penicillium verrucosum]